MIEIDPSKFVIAIRKRFRTAQNLLLMSFDRSGILYCLLAVASSFLWITPGVNAGTATDDSAHSFAQKIAAALPTKNAVSLVIHNVSGLQASDVSSVERAVES